MQQIEAFKRENDLAPDGDAGDVSVGADFDDEIDLRAEDDALIAAELEAEAARAEEEASASEDEASASEDEEDDAEKAPARRRGRRGGRGRRTGQAARGPLEGTFEHGEEGYGLWLDPAVADNPVYAEHWAGHRPVEVTIEEDQIVIRRTGDDDE